MLFESWVKNNPLASAIIEAESSQGFRTRKPSRLGSSCNLKSNPEEIKNLWSSSLVSFSNSQVHSNVMKLEGVALSTCLGLPCHAAAFFNLTGDI